jgi:hypothetical protein
MLRTPSRPIVTIARSYSTIFVSLVFLSCDSSVCAAGTQTAQRCGADQQKSPSRLFADSAGKGWKEYENIKKVPELQLNRGAAAMLWPGAGGNTLVALEEPGEDFTAYTDYCFDKFGHLIQLRYELRTAWGWGYREEGAFTNRKLKLEISQFFSTVTELPIDKPEQAEEVPEALKPHIYTKEAHLAFFKLLSK